MTIQNLRLSFLGLVAVLSALGTLACPAAAQSFVVSNLDLSRRCKSATVVDFHAPLNYAGRPVIMLVHGGGWRSFTKATMSGFAQQYANAGFVAVNIDYPKDNTTPLEQLITKQVAAIRCVRDWIDDVGQLQGIASNRVGIVGLSAGAHLAMASALIDGPRRYRAAVGMIGVYDIAHGSLLHLSNMQAFNPMNLGNRPAPAIHIIHGAYDVHVPLAEAINFHNVLLRNGVSSTLSVIQNGGHDTLSPNYGMWSLYHFFRHL